MMDAIKKFNSVVLCLCAMFIASAAQAKPMIKPPNVAGQFYDKDPKKLSRQIEQMLKAAEVEPIAENIDVIVVPHAGLVYSGPVAAHAFKAVTQKSYKTVFVLAPTHYFQFEGVSVWAEGGFETPLGTVNVDEELSKQLIRSHEKIFFHPQVFEQEHSLEIELPFIQTVFPDAKIVAAIAGRQYNQEFLHEFAGVLVDAIGNRDDVLLVISTDMSHFHDDKTARRLDKAAYEAMAALNSDEIIANNDKTMEIDGVFPVLASILYAQKLGLKAKTLKYGNSGDVSGDRMRVVGYVALAFYGDGKPQAGTADDAALSDSQKKELIRIARETVDMYVRTGKAAEFNVYDRRFLKEEGAFVTIHKNGDLRGCIGNIIGRGPLAKTVRDMAIAAASQDPRFPPVRPEELPETDVEVSVLSRPRVTTDVGEIVMGRHGVIISRGFKSGVFLPQVADETGWTREEFLSQLCSQKAGLPRECWKDPETKIEIFTAQVFGEKDVR